MMWKKWFRFVQDSLWFHVVTRSESAIKDVLQIKIYFWLFLYSQGVTITIFPYISNTGCPSWCNAQGICAFSQDQLVNFHLLDEWWICKVPAQDNSSYVVRKLTRGWCYKRKKKISIWTDKCLKWSHLN